MIDLTMKQRTVCDMLARGFSNKEIANRLGVSPRTIESHRIEIYRKMRVRNVVELVRKVLLSERMEN